MKRAVISVLVICSLLVPAQHSKAQSYDTVERARLLAQIAQLQQQVVALEAELQARQQRVHITDGSFTRSIDVEARYRRLSDEAWQIRNSEHRLFLSVIESLWPQKYVDRLQQFVVFDESKESFDAFVETTDLDSQIWTFGVGDELVALPYSDVAEELITHELAHVFAHDDRVINLAAFIDTFWSAGQLADVERISRATDSEAAAYRYYVANPGEFVNDYAASSPEEDFAESFMYYTLGIDSGCSRCTANAKVQFFAQ